MATLPEEEVEEEAELRQEKENGSASIKEPTTGGDFTTDSGMSKPNGMTNGVANGHHPDEVVPLANGNDPHVDRNDPNFLIPPRFNPQGANPPLENGLPIAGITHPDAAVVPAHVHAATSPVITHPPELTQQQSQPRLSMDAINRMSQDGTTRSRKSLDVGQGSKRNMQMGGSKKKLGRGMSLSQMMSQKDMQSGKGQVAGGGKGMVLPFEPLCLTFSDLNYYVDLPKVWFSLCLARSHGQCHPPTVVAHVLLCTADPFICQACGTMQCLQSEQATKTQNAFAQVSLPPTSRVELSGCRALHTKRVAITTGNVTTSACHVC